MRPTIVLVHGAFAESASWDGVIDPLRDAGHSVIAAGNPLRGVSADAAMVSDVVRTIDGPVVLEAHSYGGMVMSNVDSSAGEIIGLVYIAAFAPTAGESAFSLAGMFPGSTLGDAVQPTPRADGTTDLTIVQDRFHAGASTPERGACSPPSATTERSSPTRTRATSARTCTVASSRPQTARASARSTSTGGSPARRRRPRDDRDQRGPHRPGGGLRL
jgi:pimeloyl-ACP methyl ester carboxylesterase